MERNLFINVKFLKKPFPVVKPAEMDILWCVRHINSETPPKCYWRMHVAYPAFTWSSSFIHAKRPTCNPGIHKAPAFSSLARPQKCGSHPALAPGFLFCRYSSVDCSEPAALSQRDHTSASVLSIAAGMGIERTNLRLSTSEATSCSDSFGVLDSLSTRSG